MENKNYEILSGEKVIGDIEFNTDTNTYIFNRSKDYDDINIRSGLEIYDLNTNEVVGTIDIYRQIIDMIKNNDTHNEIQVPESSTVLKTQEIQSAVRSEGTIGLIKSLKKYDLPYKRDLWINVKYNAIEYLRCLKSLPVYQKCTYKDSDYTKLMSVRFEGSCEDYRKALKIPTDIFAHKYINQSYPIVMSCQDVLHKLCIQYPYTNVNKEFKHMEDFDSDDIYNILCFIDMFEQNIIQDVYGSKMVILHRMMEKIIKYSKEKPKTPSWDITMGDIPHIDNNTKWGIVDNRYLYDLIAVLFLGVSNINVIYMGNVQELK